MIVTEYAELILPSGDSFELWNRERAKHYARERKTYGVHGKPSTDVSDLLGLGGYSDPLADGLFWGEKPLAALTTGLIPLRIIGLDLPSWSFDAVPTADGRSALVSPRMEPRLVTMEATVVGPSCCAVAEYIDCLNKQLAMCDSCDGVELRFLRCLPGELDLCGDIFETPEKWSRLCGVGVASLARPIDNRPGRGCSRCGGTKVEKVRFEFIASDPWLYGDEVELKGSIETVPSEVDCNVGDILARLCCRPTFITDVVPKPKYDVEVRADGSLCPIGWDPKEVIVVGTGDASGVADALSKICLVPAVVEEAEVAPVKEKVVDLVQNPADPNAWAIDPVNPSVWDIDPGGGFTVPCDCPIVFRDVVMINDAYDPGCPQCFENPEFVECAYRAGLVIDEDGFFAPPPGAADPVPFWNDFAVCLGIMTPDGMTPTKDGLVSIDANGCISTLVIPPAALISGATVDPVTGHVVASSVAIMEAYGYQAGVPVVKDPDLNQPVFTVTGGWKIAGDPNSDPVVEDTYGCAPFTIDSRQRIVPTKAHLPNVAATGQPLIRRDSTCGDDVPDICSPTIRVPVSTASDTDDCWTVIVTLTGKAAVPEGFDPTEDGIGVAVSLPHCPPEDPGGCALVSPVCVLTVEPVLGLGDGVLVVEGFTWSGGSLPFPAGCEIVLDGFDEDGTIEVQTEVTTCGHQAEPVCHFPVGSCSTSTPPPVVPVETSCVVCEDPFIRARWCDTFDADPGCRAVPVFEITAGDEPLGRVEVEMSWVDGCGDEQTGGFGLHGVPAGETVTIDALKRRVEVPCICEVLPRFEDGSSGLFLGTGFPSAPGDDFGLPVPTPLGLGGEWCPSGLVPLGTTWATSIPFSVIGSPPSTTISSVATDVTGGGYTFYVLSIDGTGAATPVTPVSASGTIVGSGHLQDTLGPHAGVYNLPDGEYVLVIGGQTGDDCFAELGFDCEPNDLEPRNDPSVLFGLGGGGWSWDEMETIGPVEVCVSMDAREAGFTGSEPASWCWTWTERTP